jgi:hypothetical protein
MQDDFLDYLDEMGTPSSASDENSVLLVQAILCVLHRRIVYPDLRRFALDTLAGMASSQGDGRSGSVCLNRFRCFLSGFPP